MSGSAIYESLKATGNLELQGDGVERNTSRGRDKEGNLHGAKTAPWKVCVSEEQTGKWDHSFNLKLSGVNKEYVAGRHRTELRSTTPCCSSFLTLPQRVKEYQVYKGRRRN